jgi:hypothetical protein
MPNVFPSPEAFRDSGWLPASPEVHRQWLRDLKKKVDPKTRQLKDHHHIRSSYTAADQKAAIQPVLLPAVEEFRKFIEGDPTVYTEFIRMFQGITPGADEVCVLSNHCST